MTTPAHRRYASQRDRYTKGWGPEIYGPDPDIYEPKASALHPAKAPHGLLMRIFKFMIEENHWIQPGSQILDCFGGTGRTAIAASLSGCPCTLIEIEPQFANEVIPKVITYAKRRLQQYWKADTQIILGDARKTGIPDNSIDAVITSPPYADMIHQKSTDATLRALGKSGHEPCVTAILDGYGFSAQGNIGNLGVKPKRKSPQTYGQAMTQVYTECARVLRPGGILCTITKDMVRDAIRQRIGVINKKSAQAAGLDLVAVKFGEVIRPVFDPPDLFGETTAKLAGRASYFRRWHYKRNPKSLVCFEHILFFQKKPDQPPEKQA
jgi:DNA modification methylase